MLSGLLGGVWVQSQWPPADRYRGGPEAGPWTSGLGAALLTSVSWLLIPTNALEKQLTQTEIRGQKGKDTILCQILGHVVIVWRWKSVHVPTCLYSICLQQDTRSLYKQREKGWGFFIAHTCRFWKEETKQAKIKYNFLFFPHRLRLDGCQTTFRRGEKGPTSASGVTVCIFTVGKLDLK